MRAKIGPFDFEIDGDDATLDALARPFEHYWVKTTGPEPFRFWARRAEPAELQPVDGELHIHEPTFALAYRPGHARVHYLDQAPGAPEVPLNVSFMHALSLHAIDHDALLTHAAAVLLKGKALVFVGRSGAGKSTLASWFPPEDVLNDDFVLLHRDASGAPLVSSQPFFGKSMARRIGTPLSGAAKALFVLRHAPKARIEPSTPATALSTIMASVAIPAVAQEHRKRTLGLTEPWLAARWLELEFPCDREATLATLRAGEISRTG